MKKLFYVFIAVLFLTSVKVYAEDATITDLSCTKKTGGVESSLTATVEGLEINVDDVVFEDIGDFMKCTFKINNTSDDDLEVDFESISNKSDEKITYSLTSNKGNIVKKGETNTYNLDIEYVGEYSEPKTIDNNIEISLVGNNINVPDTFLTSFGIIFYIVLIVGLIIMIITNKKSKLLVIALLLLIMPSAYALTKISVKMSNKIIINIVPKYDVIYHLDSSQRETKTLMTEDEAKNSGFLDYEKVIYDYDDEAKYLKYFIGNNPTPYYEYYVETYKESYKAGEVVTLKDLVLYDVNHDECVFNDFYVATCDNITETHIISDIGNTEQYYWYYNPDEDERDVLQFTGDGILYYQLFEPNYSIHVRPPKTFVMPNHSMNFEQTNIAPM